MENNLVEIIDKEVFSYLSPYSETKEAQTRHSPRNQIKAIAFLGFDDNIGQLVEKHYPKNSIDKLTLKHISSIGFPETNYLAEEGEISYCFNIRLGYSTPLECLNIRDQHFLFCYTKFTQKKHPNFKRGYMQKSLVIITESYIPKIFFNILDQLNQLYSNNSFNPLENEILENFLSHLDDLGPTVSLYPEIKINSLIETFSMYYLIKISSLWEMVITETPIMVLADDPKKCSDAVMLVSSLIYPLEYMGDVRPYFSIYDQDFKEYRDNSSIVSTNIPIIGVINPVCSNGFDNFFVLHFDDTYFNDMKKQNPTKKISYLNYEQVAKEEKKNFFLKSKTKFFLMPNKKLIKSFFEFVEENSNKVSYENKLDIYLRMYLIELNNNFMRTFEEYLFKYNIDEIKKICFLKENPSAYELFNEKKFISYIERESTLFNTKYVNDKKKTSELYKKFIKTKCFNNYLNKILLRIKNQQY